MLPSLYLQVGKEKNLETKFAKDLLLDTRG
jgi:hypothetical protein